MKLKHFGSPAEVLAYVFQEMLSTLEDDADALDDARDKATAAEVRRKIADIRAVEPLATVQSPAPRR